MEDLKLNPTVTILDVLGVDLCARAILDYVPVRELVRSERVCKRWQHTVHNYLKDCKILSLNYLRYNNSVGDKVAEERTHRRIEISRDCSLLSACKAIEKWGHCITKVTAGRCEEEFLQIITTNCPNLRYVEFHSLRKRISAKQIKNCKHLTKITFRNVQKSSDSGSGVTSSIVDCDGIEFDNINIDLFTTEDFLESIKNINLNSLKFVPHNSGTIATLKLNGADLTLLGISPKCNFFTSEAKCHHIYLLLLLNKIEHILQPLLCLDSV